VSANTIFPDVESLLVSRLNAALVASTAPVSSNVFVSVRKPPPDQTPYPPKIVTIRYDGGSDLVRGITVSERVGVNVYAQTYADANQLSRLVESLMRQLVGGAIKLVETNSGPVPIPNDSVEEQRYLVFDMVVKATDN
jgi:hypothetical protein